MQYWSRLAFVLGVCVCLGNVTRSSHVSYQFELASISSLICVFGVQYFLEIRLLLVDVISENSAPPHFPSNTYDAFCIS